MLYGTDLSSLETEVRDLIGEETAALWTAAGIRRAINNETSRLIRHAIDSDQGYFETSYTVTPSTVTNALPANFYRLRNLEIYRDSLWQPLRWISTNDRYIFQSVTGVDTASYAVRFEGSNLVIESGLGTTASLRIQYAYVPPPMVLGTTSAGAATSITMVGGLAVNDVYNLCRIYLYDGTGEGQFNTITDYVGSTGVATVGTWATNPSTDTLWSLSLPDPIDKWSDLVVSGAAMRLLTRRRDTEMINTIGAQYAIDLDRFRSSLRRRQTDQPPRVRLIPDAVEYYTWG